MNCPIFFFFNVESSVLQTNWKASCMLLFSMFGAWNYLEWFVSTHNMYVMLIIHPHCFLASPAVDRFQGHERRVCLLNKYRHHILSDRKWTSFNMFQQ